MAHYDHRAGLCGTAAKVASVVHDCRKLVVHRSTPTYFCELSDSLIINIINSRVGWGGVMPVPGACCAVPLLVASMLDLLTYLLIYTHVVNYRVGCALSVHLIVL